MAKDQALKIEILSAKHPGLLLEVDQLFDRYAFLSHVQRLIEEKCHQTISLTPSPTISKNSGNGEGIWSKTKLPACAP